MIIHNMDQKSSEWYDIRRGIPTASAFKSLLTMKDLLKDEVVERVSCLCNETNFKKKTLAELLEIARNEDIDVSPKWVAASTNYHYQLAAEILAGSDSDPWTGNENTNHGLESESEAIKEYEAKTGLVTAPVGFVTDDDKTMGCSPDRFVGDDGLLEIKALYAKNIIKAFCESDVNCPVDFRLQVQGQLMITERRWCDLVLHHPAMELKIIRVLPDIGIHEMLREQVKAVTQKRDEAILKMSGF